MRFLLFQTTTLTLHLLSHNLFFNCFIFRCLYHILNSRKNTGLKDCTQRISNQRPQEITIIPYFREQVRKHALWRQKKIGLMTINEPNVDRLYGSHDNLVALTSYRRPAVQEQGIRLTQICEFWKVLVCCFFFSLLSMLEDWKHSPQFNKLIYRFNIFSHSKETGIHSTLMFYLLQTRAENKLRKQKKFIALPNPSPWHRKSPNYKHPCWSLSLNCFPQLALETPCFKRISQYSSIFSLWISL